MLAEIGASQRGFVVEVRFEVNILLSRLPLYEIYDTVTVRGRMEQQNIYVRQLKDLYGSSCTQSFYLLPLTKHDDV